MAWKGGDWTEEGRRGGQKRAEEEEKGRRKEGGERDYSGGFSLKGNVPHVACNVWLSGNGNQKYVVLMSTNL